MLTPCMECGTLAPRGRCQAHPAPPRDRSRDTPRQRNTTAEGYDHAWRTLRPQILERDQWTCHYCGKHLHGTDATVDHLIPIRRAPDLRLEPANLIAACRSCNSTRANRSRS